jgi:hypothetical protein
MTFTAWILSYPLCGPASIVENTVPVNISMKAIARTLTQTNPLDPGYRVVTA